MYKYEYGVRHNREQEKETHHRNNSKDIISHDIGRRITWPGNVKKEQPPNNILAGNATAIYTPTPPLVDTPLRCRTPLEGSLNEMETVKVAGDA
jgi:hypothetical protein